MVFGAVLTPNGWKKVSLDIHVQKAGLPQFIIQGFGSGVKAFRQAVLVALQKLEVSLPHGKVVIQISLPDGPVWGTEGLLLPIVMLIQEKMQKFQHQRDIVASGTSDFSGNIFCIEALASLVAQSQLGSRVVGRIPTQARPWISGEVFEFVNVQSLHKGEWVPLQLEASVPSFSGSSHSNFTLPALSELHELCLALVWAGGHSLLLFGSPGEGKTLSRQWLEALAPPLTQIELCVRTELQGVLSASSVAHVTTIPASTTLSQWKSAPFGFLRTLVFGAGWIDELPELSSTIRVWLRSVLDRSDAQVRSLVQRGWYTSLVATMNPCPCGYWGESRCVCTLSGVSQGVKKVSWPLMERFQLQWRVESPDTLAGQSSHAHVEVLKKKIALARSAQRVRSHFFNASAEIWDLTAAVREELRVWGHHCSDWSPRRQVFLAQVAQTLIDGQWCKNASEAFALAWQVCRGAEALRPIVQGKAGTE